MSAVTRHPHWRFDDFVEGAERHVDVSPDPSQIEDWQQIFGSGARRGVMPSGLLVAAMMKANIHAFQPRPAGNIHVGQKLEFSGARVAIGDRLIATVACRRKELRKDRHWLTFEVALRADQRLVLRGEIQIIWAE